MKLLVLSLAALLVMAGVVTGHAFAQGCGMPGMSCGGTNTSHSAAQPGQKLPPPENQLVLTGKVVSVETNGAALVDIGTARVYVVPPPPAPTPDGAVPPSPFKVGDRIQVAGVLMALSIQPAPAPAGTVYTCPMHPEVQSSKPGQCPKCGMNLIKQGK